MIWKNILRRKGRTLLTILGISVGVAAIIGLGALANGFEAGYNSMLSGSNADLVVSQPEALDISLSAIDEQLGSDLAALSEVRAVSGMLEGFVQAEGSPFFFVFGYQLDSFLLERFQIVEGIEFSPRIYGAQRACNLDRFRCSRKPEQRGRGLAAAWRQSLQGGWNLPDR